MKKLLAAFVVLAAVAIGMHTQSAVAVPTDPVRETRNIDAKVSRVRLNGVIHLVLHQGAVPSLVLSGDRADVARVKTVQQGDTLDIGTEDGRRFSRHGELRADMTVPNLQEFVSAGVGSSEVSGFTGDRLTMALKGAGAVTFSGQYRDVNARLAGVGNLTLNPGHTEQIELNLGGAGQIKVSGQAKVLRAHLAGVGDLDAQQLQAEQVELRMSGLGGASVYASTAANVTLSGMGSATVFGKPASRNATTNGFGSVSWR